MGIKEFLQKGKELADAAEVEFGDEYMAWQIHNAVIRVAQSHGYDELTALEIAGYDDE